MFGIKYYKADSSTYVIASANGKMRRKGSGLSFFYNTAVTSIAQIPINALEAPFIFSLQTADFQAVKVQGQITFQIIEPQKAAQTLNFNVKDSDASYVSDDPLKLNDRVVRSVQTLVQGEIQRTKLRDALQLNQELVSFMRKTLLESPILSNLGVSVIDIAISAITPTPETSRALEAHARENILKEADDAIYSRRKFAVEQERTIKDAELQTELEVQQKEQEIAESRLDNERNLLREEALTTQERIQAEVDAQTQRKRLVELNAQNKQLESDAEAYAIQSRMKAFKELPVENLKAMSLANMAPDQLIAMAFDTLAQNADKIGELNIGPDLFSQISKKVRK
ncbi:MAG: NrtR-regulated NrtX [Saccharospirillaceae bacterium]|nr:SPFH domain-containing protein [Pseudomonadales bacterium]NRB79611.1 NrtR-regulated NrtX [Saccharospirillaceae bacterium]